MSTPFTARRYSRKVDELQPRQRGGESRRLPRDLAVAEPPLPVHQQFPVGVRPRPVLEEGSEVGGRHGLGSKA